MTPMADPASRYAAVPDVALPDARGTVVVAQDLRLLPEVTGTFRHEVRQDDRLDQLAGRYYGTGTLWWRICDANPDTLSPLDLLAGGPVATTRVGVRAPAAVPGAAPDWAGLARALVALVGVDRVLVEDGAVRVTHNRATVAGADLVATITAAGFVAGPVVELGPLGRRIVVPPRTSG